MAVRKSLEPTDAQAKKWTTQYAEVVKQVRISYKVMISDDSSLEQPSPYEDVPTVFATSAGDEPVIG